MAARTSRRLPALTWPDVLRALPDPEARSWAVSSLRNAGFSADSFGSKTKARQVVADALARVEDQMELNHASRARQLVRGVRRRLEAELWP